MISKHRKIVAARRSQSHGKTRSSLLGPEEYIGLQDHQPGLLIFKSFLQHIITFLDILS